ncbi:hypothetical protein PoB_005427600 [Plakobranchus ocellatus]|uniref:Uncharacterized protein n=1 Tax=Plakobranchus ocellatus TaxID=259542 RepID=A0AAV4C4W9_9GAST|nr:hypothetical protein PoB_005427600 [Plakobranchus ocellatus]
MLKYWARTIQNPLTQPEVHFRDPHCQVKIWLEKVASITATAREGCIQDRLENILQSCKQMGEEETSVFLQEEHDFNAPVQPLSALGLTRLHLIGIDLQLRASSLILNDVICLEHFCAQERMPANVSDQTGTDFMFCM